MPPLNDNQIRIKLIDNSRTFKNIKGIGGIYKILGIIDLKALVILIPLFLLKKNPGILHAVGYGMYLTAFFKGSDKQSRIMGYATLKRIDRTDNDNFIKRPFCVFHFRQSPYGVS